MRYHDVMRKTVIATAFALTCGCATELPEDFTSEEMSRPATGEALAMTGPAPVGAPNTLPVDAPNAAPARAHQPSPAEEQNTASTMASNTAPADVGSTVTVSGVATVFGLACDLLDGAVIRQLEREDIETVSAEDGTFVLEGIEVGKEMTLEINAPGLFPTQLGTLIPDETGFNDLTFQVPWNAFARGLAYLSGLDPDLKKCQIATTVTRAVYHPMPQCATMGEPGATVTIEPPLSPEHGPVYFNEKVLPDPALTETSVDGGVVFADVPPGEYILRAHKEGVVFREVYIKCQPHTLVNASPPWGLQALEGGIGDP